MEYTIKTKIFEGPLDLLLSLIEKRKLLINDISLAAVTDDFIEYINASENRRTMGDIVSFVHTAATLLLIKSKSLLPALSFTEEEEESMENLEERLRRYQRVKELSQHMEHRFGKHPLFGRERGGHRAVVFAPSNDLTLQALLSGIRDVIAEFPKSTATTSAVVRKVISLEAVIDRLSERIRTGIRMSFNEISKRGSAEKVDVIVHFLALLELVKRGLISVRQDDRHSDITIETDEVNTPRYS